jgi:hypothetical protein
VASQHDICGTQPAWRRYHLGHLKTRPLPRGSPLVRAEVSSQVSAGPEVSSAPSGDHTPSSQGTLPTDTRTVETLTHISFAGTMTPHVHEFESWQLLDSCMLLPVRWDPMTPEDESPGWASLVLAMAQPIMEAITFNLHQDTLLVGRVEGPNNSNWVELPASPPSVHAS